MSAHILPHVLTQHAEEAAALWEQRGVQWDLPHIRLKDIVEHDQRIEAHVDGLRIAGDAAWPVLRATNFEEPGQVFVAALLALEGGKDEQVQEMIRAGSVSGLHRRGLIGAMAWLPADAAMRRVLPLLASKPVGLRYVGIAAALAHRRHPGPALEQALNAPQPKLQALALRGVGELGTHELLAAVRPHLSADDPDVKYAAAWTLALREGHAGAIDHLLEVATSDSPRRGEAFNVAVRRMDPASARRWLETLAAVPGVERLGARGLGLIGDPHEVPRLLEYMSDPALARAAGEAFTFITGADLNQEYLKAEPEPSQPPADEESPAADPDEDLPWPDAAKVQHWWEGHRSQFAPGKRFLLGKPMTPDWLRQVLKIGRQRHRVAAALELAIREPTRPLFDLRAPGFRQ